MGGFHAAPLFFEVFRDQSSVTVMWFFFRAEQARMLEQGRINALFNLTLAHQGEKLCLVDRPPAFFLLVLVQNILSRREVWQMNVVDAGHRAEKIAQVVLLGKAGKLRGVVEADID